MSAEAAHFHPLPRFDAGEGGDPSQSDGEGEGIMKTDLSQRRARELRQQSTEAEKKLWQHLCNRQLDGIKFRRQVPIGPYIADFAAVEALLIIELDGGQHADQAPMRTALRG